MSQPTDASDEGEVMPNDTGRDSDASATRSRTGLHAVTGDGASDQHAIDAERYAREWWNAHWTQSDGAAISSLAALLRQREEELRAERDELAMRAREITCVWCGHQFQSTLQSQAEHLYEHAKTCEKHPIRALEAQVAGLKDRATWGDMAYADHERMRAEVEALNASVAQLSEALAQCCQSGHEIAGMAESFIWSRDVKSLTNYGSNVASLANAALSGTGTDWLEAHDAKVRGETRDRIVTFLRRNEYELALWAKGEWNTVQLCEFMAERLSDKELSGSADAPEGRDG